jgi:hypothetical protein
MRIGDSKMGFRGTLLVAIFGLLAIANGCLASDTTSVTSQFCKTSEACVREWFSALSGWVGAIATIVTLLLLRQQIKEANTHHRQALHAEHHDKIALAQRLRERIADLRKDCARFCEHEYVTRTDHEDRNYAFLYIDASLYVNTGSICNPDLEVGEKLFMTHPHESLEEIRSAMKAALQMFSRKELLDNDERLWKFAVTSASMHTKRTLEYCIECEKTVNDYLAGISSTNISHRKNAAKMP